jgi:hypothetical protein
MQELPSVVVRKVQKLIVLYKQSKKNPKITGWGQGWYLADSKTTVLKKHRDPLVVEPAKH